MVRDLDLKVGDRFVIQHWSRQVLSTKTIQCKVESISSDGMWIQVDGVSEFWDWDCLDHADIVRIGEI